MLELVYSLAAPVFGQLISEVVVKASFNSPVPAKTQ
jgi:hypothetical protein